MRTAHLLIATLTVTLSLCLLGCGKVTVVNTNGPSDPTPASKLNIQQQITGQSMALKLPNVFLINTEAHLNGTRSNKLKSLDVDFNKQSVVLIALGEQKTGGYWIKITGIEASDNGDAFVQAIVNKPSKTDTVTQALTYPFAAIVTGKITGKIIPEIESVQGQPIN